MAQPFNAWIEMDEKHIYQLDTMTGQKKVIGYTQEAYDESIEIAAAFEQTLIDKGIIVKEPTLEELAQQKAEENNKLLTELLKQVGDIGQTMGGVISKVDSVVERITNVEKKVGVDKDGYRLQESS